MKKLVLLPYDRYQRLLDKEVSPNVQEAVQSTVQEPVQEVKEPVETQGSAPETNVKTETDSETLVQHFPKTLQNRVRSVLNYIRPHVRWNDRGEVTIDGVEIPGSNIVDLLKVHIKEYKNFHPVGQEAFGKLLTKLNVPTSLLSPSARQKSGQGQVPPPPGIPIKRPGIPLEHPEKTTKPSKWLRL